MKKRNVYKNRNINLKLFDVFALVLLLVPLVFADGFTPSQASHAILYTDTITSKTDSSPVGVADAQGLFVTGDVTTLGKVGIGTTNPAGILDVVGGTASLFKLTATGDAILQPGTGNSANAVLIKDDLGTTNIEVSRNNGVLLSSNLEFSGTRSIGRISGVNAPDKAFLKTSLTVGAGGGFAEVSGGVAAFNGNVGIGTTAPTELLQVGGSTGNNYIMVSSGSGSGGSGLAGIKLRPLALQQFGFTIQNDDTSASGLTGLNILRHDGTVPGVSALFIARSTGNVGIGTTNPQRTLHVRTGASGASGIDGSTNMVIENSAGVGIQFLSPNSYNGHLFFGDPEDATAGGFIYRHGANEMAVYVNSVIPMLITSNGNVGIGDTLTGAPDAKLEVSADGGASDLFMLSSNDDTDGDRFIVKNSGNVGIGTTNPSQKLDVAGSIRSSSLSGTGNAYVCVNANGDIYRSATVCA